MAVEDLTTYTELDPSSELAVTSTVITYTDVGRTDDAWVYDDKGVAFFDGDFTHHFDIKVTADGDFGLNAVWGLKNTVSALDVDDDELFAFPYGNGGTFGTLFLREIDADTAYSDTFTISIDTFYYLEVERDEAVGTFGTLYARIYSDSNRTTLLDTLSITLHTSKKDWRYIYAFNALNDGDAQINRYQSGIAQNLDLSPAPVGGAPLRIHRTMSGGMNQVSGGMQ